MKLWKKILLNASLSSVLATGCAYNKVNQTFQSRTIPLEDACLYCRLIRSNIKDPQEMYKSDLRFVFECAQNDKKEFFEFDGSTYKVDESAFEQVDALISARKQGKKEFSFKGEKREACSFYPALEQMAIFGNLWEEIISPQSAQTKYLLRKCAEKTAFIPQYVHFTLNRLYELCRLSGYPEVKDVREDNSLIGAVIAGSSGRLTSYYSPAIFTRPTIYIAPDKNKQEVGYKEIICELPHAFRNDNNMFGETAQFLADGIKDILTLTSIGFGRSAQSKNYDNPNRMEYDAHTIIEPLIKEYITNPQMSLADFYHKIEDMRTKNGNKYTLTPSARKTLKEKRTGKNEFSVKIFGYRRTFDGK